ncbi:MAG: four helix bundle protein [Clostridia bacterium]|nr:four helix bundle protein [Clostridia bacterium]
MESVACDGMESRRRREWHHASACISVGLIPCATSSQFHAAISCGSNTRFGRDLDAKGNDMAKNLLLEYSEQLASEITILCNENKIDSNTVYQIKKSSSSVFANISEAQYPQSLADMLSKFEISRKECMETESWLKLMFSSGSIDEESFKKYRNLCGRIRRMLTASCITIENKIKQG